jgi:hypothetical protein
MGKMKEMWMEMTTSDKIIHTLLAKIMEGKK